jgi:undecaprenyl diphosphate synthase
MDHNICLMAIGNLGNLPQKSRDELLKVIDDTSKNTGLKLVLALSYSSRWEILEAARSLAKKVNEGILSIDEINYETFSNVLTTALIPDPELLIRTSGEYRVSNFLLWQIAYSELYFTSTFWPDFTREEFYKALIDYQGRERRFGMTSEQINEPKTRYLK